MTMEAVVTAIRALHGATILEDRNKADSWLRQWQVSPAAWESADNLLLNSTEYEVQHTAAITLRTKLMYDFTQLPASSHEALCSSLLNHIERFKDPSSRVILTTLALAFADLSIHTCRAWPGFLDVLHSKLSSSDDVMALLTCLKVLPEENLNSRILVDPDDRHAHAAILSSKIPWIATQLERIIHASGGKQEVAVRVLECFVEWARFAEESSEFRDSSLFPDFLIDICFQLVSSTNGDISETAVECLNEAVSLAVRRPEAHQTFIERTLQELASPTGCIRAALVTALETDDGETTLRLARIYRNACSASRDKLTALFWRREPVVKELLSILIRLTSIQFDLEDDTRSSNGIAATMLYFWDRFASKLASQRRIITEGDNIHETNDGKKEHERFNGAFKFDFFPNPNDTNSIAEAMIEQNSLAELLLHNLLEQYVLPPQLFSDTVFVSGYDFYRFRDYICITLLHLARVLTLEGVFSRVLQSLMTTRSSDPIIAFRAQEAHLACITCLIEDAPSNFFLLQNEDSLVIENSTQPNERTQVILSLFKLFEGLSGLLVSTPPVSVLDCLARTAAAQLLSAASRKMPLFNKPEELPKLLESLGHQIFCSDLVDSYNDVTKESCLMQARRTLADTSSEALRLVCVWCQDGATMQYLLTTVFSALSQYPTIREKTYVNVLEGLATIVAYLEHDNEFLRWSGELLNPGLTAIVSVDDITRLSILLDRFSLLLRTLSPEGPLTVRRNALGTFFKIQLWPVIEHLMKTKPESALLIERCGRVLKHGMRCIQGELFKDLVPGLVTLVIANSKIYLHSTYLYISEWLIAEYNEDRDVCPTLDLLFNELSQLGLGTLTLRIETGKLLEEGNLIEDCFGMFCRYLRFCPTVPGNSNSLSDAFQVAYPCLYHANILAVGMVCSFLENVAYVIRTCEPEEGTYLHDDESLRKAHHCIETLFYQNLSRTVSEFFKLIQSLPQLGVVDLIISVLAEYRKLPNPDLLEAALRDGLDCLPSAVLVNQNFKETVISDILNGHVEAPLHDIYRRCRYVGLRYREANQSILPQI